MDNQGYIVVRGAKGHNLKNINLELPRNKLTVIAGLSGSGKSNLTFVVFSSKNQKLISD